MHVFQLNQNISNLYFLMNLKNKNEFVFVCTDPSSVRDRDVLKGFLWPGEEIHERNLINFQSQHCVNILYTYLYYS